MTLVDARLFATLFIYYLKQKVKRNISTQKECSLSLTLMVVASLAMLMSETVVRVLNESYFLREEIINFEKIKTLT